MKTNEGIQNKPWLDGDGIILPDSELKIISKSWSPQVWENFLVDTVERNRSHEVEHLLKPKRYDYKLHNMTASIWEDGPHDSDPLHSLLRKTCREKLTARQQQVIRCLYWDGLTERKTAEVVGVTRSTIEKQKKAALQKIREVLEREMPEILGCL